MNNRRLIVITLIIVAVLALGIGSFFYTFKRQWVTETSPPVGAARYNRFFALEGVLKNMGQPASSHVVLGRILPSLRPGDTIVIGDDVSRIDANEASTLVDWVRAGGHLAFSPGVRSARDVPLLKRLNMLDESAGGWTCLVLSPDGASGSNHVPSSMQLCGVSFQLQPQALARASVAISDSSHKGLVFARVREGRGTVSLLDDLDVIAGQHLKNRPEQQFAWRLLAPNFGRGHCYLFYTLIGTSFWASLFIHGWPALLASLLWVLGWAAARSQRFGPLMPAPSVHRRALLEHIQAVGEFLFRRDGGRSLHRLACAALLARLRRRDPASALLQDGELYDWLAQRSRLQPVHIENAFRSPANAAAFRASITVLAQLRSHL